MAKSRLEDWIDRWLWTTANRRGTFQRFVAGAVFLVLAGLLAGLATVVLI